MMILITGGSGSGKSAFAEERLLSISEGDDRYYLATMKVFGEGGRKKVERHKNLRKGKGFVTIERTASVKDAVCEISNPSDSAVLLECMSNLTANEMFRDDGIQSAETVEKAIISDITVLKEQLKHLMIVTNNVFEDGIQYDVGTMEYMKTLGRINETLASMADEVTEVVVGIPVSIKKG